MKAAELDLDLDVFAGPFDLLMAIVLREEVSLAEVSLGEIVVAYLEHLESAGELELDAATEFLVLIASLDRRLAVVRELLNRRGSFDFDELFADEDRLTQAVTLFALLEMHKRGEASWKQKELFGSIEVRTNP